MSIRGILAMEVPSRVRREIAKANVLVQVQQKALVGAKQGPMAIIAIPRSSMTIAKYTPAASHHSR